MNFPGKKIMPRFFIIAVLLTMVGLVIIGKAAYIMSVQREFWTEVSEQFKKDNLAVPPTRGDILSDDGEVLAASIPEYKIYMDFMSGETDPKRVVKDQRRRDSLLDVKMDSICEGLHAILPDVDPAKMREHLLEGREKKSKNWLIYPKRVSYIQYKEIAKLPLFKLPPYRGGFHVEKFETRKNPFGKLAARTVGDLYKGKDSARSGIELGYDSILRGKPGVSHRQRVFNKYLTIIDQPATDGYDVQTTLNINMQDICEKALGDQLRELQDQGTGDVRFGTCILMEVATGDVKAIVSLTRVADGNFYEIENKAISNLMEPGSVFKPMSFLVAFNDGFLHLDDQVNTGNGVKEMHGRSMKDHNHRSGGYGTLTARQCIQKSSNVGVSTFIDRFYGKNPQKFVDGIYATGVAEDLHIPIPGYAKPRIKSPKDSKQYWSKTDLPWMSIGYVTQIPPISTLTFYNGIANNGRMMQPRFVKALWHKGEKVRDIEPVVVREHMASDEAVRCIQTCLREVVTLGVGKKAGSKLVHTAGKTGTAQVWSAAGRTSEYLVSFAGFFPFENPKYSCIVCINKSGSASGGSQCGPVFRRIAETVMAQQRIEDYTSARDSFNTKQPLVRSGNLCATARALERLGLKKYGLEETSEVLVWGAARTKGDGIALSAVRSEAGVMPDVRGYGLRDAVFRLEKEGLRVRVHGVGYVLRQSIEPGHHIKKGETAELFLGSGRKEDIQIADSLAEQLKEDTTQTPRPDDDEAVGVHPDSAKAKPTTKAQQSVKKPQEKKEAPKQKPAEKPKATVTEKKPTAAATKPKDKPKSPADNKPKATQQKTANSTKKKA
ncbi:MAG: PASTA domain-containing protein [Alloprevotella sp.]|nr:PASTA domain-containing protein [Alloprevotella sp.]